MTEGGGTTRSCAWADVGQLAVSARISLLEGSQLLAHVDGRNRDRNQCQLATLEEFLQV